jgi:hypothetical protein
MVADTKLKENKKVSEKEKLNERGETTEAGGKEQKKLATVLNH